MKRTHYVIFADHLRESLPAADFLTACDVAKDCGAFVAQPERVGFLIYRPTQDGRGRMIGSVIDLAEVSEMVANRCEFCGWPYRTGFLSEADQRTPYCDHDGLCRDCGRELSHVFHDHDGGPAHTSSHFFRT